MRLCCFLQTGGEKTKMTTNEVARLNANGEVDENRLKKVFHWGGA